MDPIPIVVERLMSSSEKSNSESFLLSAFYKGLLLLVAATTSLIGTLNILVKVQLTAMEAMPFQNQLRRCTA
jgi:hypothetical protein